MKLNKKQEDALLKAKLNLYSCLLSLPNEYFLEDTCDDSLITSLTSDRQIQEYLQKQLDSEKKSC